MQRYNNIKNQINTSTPKDTNSIVLDSNENGLKELSDKELKRTSITMVKHFKEDKNIERNELSMPI